MALPIYYIYDGGLTVINIRDFILKEKWACFDFDHTLFKPKAGRKFAKNVEDWKLVNPSIPFVLNTLIMQEFCILVFTNQSKKWKREYILASLMSLNIPILAAIAEDNYYRKPYPKMVESILKSPIFNPYHISFDPKCSFFTGDASGDPGAWSNTDFLFAENAGLRFTNPRDILIDTSAFKWTTINSDEYHRQEKAITSCSFIVKKELLSQKTKGSIYLTKVFVNLEEFLVYYYAKMEKNELLTHNEVMYPSNRIREFYDIDISPPPESYSDARIYNIVFNIIKQFHDIYLHRPLLAENMRVLQSSGPFKTSLHVINTGGAYNSVDDLSEMYTKFKFFLNELSPLEGVSWFDTTVVGKCRLLRLPYSAKAADPKRIFVPAEFHCYSKNSDIRDFFVTGFLGE